VSWFTQSLFIYSTSLTFGSPNDTVFQVLVAFLHDFAVVTWLHVKWNYLIIIIIIIIIFYFHLNKLTVSTVQ